MSHKQHPNSKLAFVGFIPGRKTEQKRLTKVLAKASSGNDSFILLFMTVKEAVRDGILNINQEAK